MKGRLISHDDGGEGADLGVPTNLYIDTMDTWAYLFGLLPGVELDQQPTLPRQTMLRV